MLDLVLDLFIVFGLLMFLVFSALPLLGLPQTSLNQDIQAYVDKLNTSYKFKLWFIPFFPIAFFFTIIFYRIIFKQAVDGLFLPNFEPLPIDLFEIPTQDSMELVLGLFMYFIIGFVDAIPLISTMEQQMDLQDSDVTIIWLGFFFYKIILVVIWPIISLLEAVLIQSRQTADL